MQENEKYVLENLYVGIQSSIIHISQIAETTQMTFKTGIV
jgi:hypothetical protein